MRHTETVLVRNSKDDKGSHKRTDQPLPDPKNPGRAFLQGEIESNRKSERWLVLKALIAMAGVAVLVALRLVFFP